MSGFTIDDAIDKIPLLINPQRAMRGRKSRRLFIGKDLEGFKKNKLQYVCDAASTGYFGEETILSLLDRRAVRSKQKIDLNKGYGPNWNIKLHPYILIPAALGISMPERMTHDDNAVTLPRYFLVAAVKGGESRTHKTPYDDYQFHYGLTGASAGFYKAILMATELGLGSCIYGYLRPEKFRDALGLDSSWNIPMISPVGYCPMINKGEQKIRDRHHSDARESFGTRFFDMDLNPLNPDGSEICDALENVRLGPSAGNRQAWRMYVDDGAIHLYVVLDAIKEGYRKRNLNDMDAGIAMVNFGFMAKKNGVVGGWEVLPRTGLSLQPDHLYVASYLRSA